MKRLITATHESASGPKPTNFVACGWSGFQGSPDFASAILRPPLVTPAVRKRRAAVMILPVILGGSMRRFVEEADRGQWTLLPECLPR
jgi:hypothetical protein